MDRTELIKFLMIFRMSRAGQASGLPEDLAIAQAEEVVRQQVTSEMAALSTPDGAIVVMVETFLNYVGPIVGGVFDIENPPNYPMFIAASAEAIGKIEAHRSTMFGGERVPPTHFPAYVYYRTCIEIRKQFQISPDQMGLDEQTVCHMIKFCIAALAPRYARNILELSEDEVVAESNASFHFTPTELSAYGFHQLDELREALQRGKPDELYAIRNAIGRKIGRLAGVDDERPFLEAYRDQLEKYLEANPTQPAKAVAQAGQNMMGLPNWVWWGCGSLIFLIGMFALISPSPEVSSDNTYGLSQSDAERAAAAAIGGGLFALLALIVLYYFIRGFEAPSRARKYAAWASFSSAPFWMAIGNEAFLAQSNEAAIGRLVGFGLLAIIIVGGAFTAGTAISYFEKLRKNYEA